MKEVMGLDAESVALAWRMPTTVDDDVISALISSILYNGQAGLLDVNLNQRRKFWDVSQAHSVCRTTILI